MNPSRPADVSFSVVIALYNKAQFIEMALRSVVAQTFPATEIIVVDDGSTDAGPALVEKLALPNVKLITIANSGPGPARNHGLSKATGEFVALIDADDLWAPNHLEALNRIVNAYPRALMIGTDYVEFSGLFPVLSKPSSTNSTPRPFDYFREQNRRSRIWTSAVAVNRRAAIEIGGFGEFCPGEDKWLWQALALRGDVAVVDQVTSYYRRDIDGIMDQVQRSAAFRPIITRPMAQLDEYIARHPSAANVAGVRGYQQAQWETVLRQFIYREQTEAAAWTVDQMGRRHLNVPPLLASLARLPRPVLSLVISLHNMRKRWRKPHPSDAANPGSGGAV